MPHGNGKEPERKRLAHCSERRHLFRRADHHSFESATPVGWQKTSPRVHSGPWVFVAHEEDRAAH